jgi:hypothetical protein
MLICPTVNHCYRLILKVNLVIQNQREVPPGNVPRPNKSQSQNPKKLKARVESLPNLKRQNLFRRSNRVKEENPHNLLKSLKRVITRNLLFNKKISLISMT